MATQKMATSKSALSVALRKRFPGTDGKKTLLARLGLSMDDLAPPAPGGGGGSGGDDRLRALRVEIENALSEMKNLPEGSVAKILATLDKHVRLDKLPDDDPQVGAVRKITGDDDEEDLIARVKAFLKSRGLSDADADEAWSLAQACLPVADRLPLDATRGGMGGYGHGGENDRVGRGPAMDESTRSRVASEMDVLLGTGRVTVGFDTRQPRRAVPVPTATSVASFEAMFADAKRIGV